MFFIYFLKLISSLECLKLINFEERYYTIINPNNINLENCYFYRFNTLNDNGGVFYINSNNVILNLTKITFFNCSSNLKCGVLFFESISGNCYLNNICGSNCFTLTNNEGQFGSILVSSNMNIFLNLISLTKCTPLENPLGYYNLILRYGNQKLNNNNFSKNICKSESGICNFYVNSNYGDFCNFFNNSVITQIIINYHSLNFHSNIQRYSIISNSKNLIIYNGGFVTMNNCIFKKNIGILFQSSVYVGATHLLTISSSYIEHNDILYQNTVTFSNINTIFTNTFDFINIFCNYNLIHSKNKIKSKKYFLIFSFLYLKE